MSESSTSPTEAGHPRRFWARLGGVLRLDARSFAEAEADSWGLAQAAGIVLIAGIAKGISGASADAGPGVVGGVAFAFVMWILAAGLLTTIGVGWLHGTSDSREMLRDLGFAAVPLWLLAPLLVVAEPAYTVISVLIHVWAIAAAVVAVRQALNVTTARAAAACALSLGLAIGLFMLLGTPLAPGLGA